MEEKSIKIVKAYETSELKEPLTARGLLESVKEYIPDGYDIPIRTVNGKTVGSEIIFDFTAAAPTIIVLSDDAGNPLSVYLFVK